MHRFILRLLAPVVVVSCATGLTRPGEADGYICTESAFEEGGYEPSASAVVPESEERMKTAIRQMLGVESSAQNE